jgi:hypothetical protein
MKATAHQKLVAQGVWGPGAARLWGAEARRACGPARSAFVITYIALVRAERPQGA